MTTINVNEDTIGPDELLKTFDLYFSVRKNIKAIRL